MSDNNYPIYVTKPFLPPKEEFQSYVDGIWDRQYLTNAGPLVRELEEKLESYLGVPHVNLFNNATIALMAALPVLDIDGEVITTPYTFVATAHSIIWGRCKPVFVDIDPDTMNICPKAIEAAVTHKTQAIMAVHVYGRPCDTTAIKAIADKHNLRVIYDAAHAFHVQDDGGSIARHGDLSILSFHATKVFNTFEGGAIISNDANIKEAITSFQNFGLERGVDVTALGLNGKQSEIHAAMGLCMLPHIDEAIIARKRVYDFYRAELGDVTGIRLPDYSDITKPNYAYFPIIIEDDFATDRDGLHDHMNALNIFPRKYFWPVITDFAPYKNYRTECPVSEDKANRVLCLPIYPDLTGEELHRIVSAIKSV